MTLVNYRRPAPSLFESFFNNELNGWDKNNFSNEGSTLPSINIKEDNENFKVEVAAPGFNKADFNIELDNDLLTISSDRQQSTEEKEDEKVTKREFSYRSFRRSFTLPELVEVEKISATYENGILNVSIPKKEEAKPKPVKQIEIS